MCGLCGILGNTHWAEISAHSDVFTSENLPSVRSERIARTNKINRILLPRRVSVGDFEASNYIVSSPTGKRVIVDDIQSVWTAVEQLTGSPIDPLDPGFLDELEKIER